MIKTRDTRDTRHETFRQKIAMLNLLFPLCELVVNLRIELENLRFYLENLRFYLENLRIELKNLRIELENLRIDLENLRIELEKQGVSGRASIVCLATKQGRSR